MERQVDLYDNRNVKRTQEQVCTVLSHLASRRT